MRAQSIDKELAIEVIEANRGVLSNLVAQRVGKLITHPHTEGAIEDIGLGGLIGIGSREGHDTLYITTHIKHTARVAALNEPYLLAEVIAPIHLLEYIPERCSG